MEKFQYTVMYEVEEKHFWFNVMARISQFLLHTYLPKPASLSIKRKILDAGCGTGGSFSFLKNYGETYGIDISSYAIFLCKKRGLKNVKVESVDNISYPSNFFDAVTCFDVLGQQEIVNDKKALSEFHRVLKSGGLFLLRIAAYNWLKSHHDRSVHTNHRYTVSELHTLLTQYGFTIVRLTYINSIFFPAIVVKRLLEKVFPQKSYKNSDVYKLPFFLNLLCKYIFLIEYHLLKYISFPFGLSVIAVARKKKKSDHQYESSR